MRKLFGVLGGITIFSLWALGIGIYVFCLYLAYLTSFLAVLLTFFFPVVGQLFWIWAIWATTGIFLNPLTIACLLWVGLAVLGFVLMNMSAPAS